MAVVQYLEPTEEVQQVSMYNSGMAPVTFGFPPPANQPWAVIATELDASVNLPDDVPTLASEIAALPQVTSVNGDQVCNDNLGSPTQIATGYEHRLIVGTTYSAVKSAGVSQHNLREYLDSDTKIPAGRKWCVFALRVPNPMTEADAEALETSVETIAGVARCEHLVHSVTAIDQGSPANLSIAVNTRMDQPLPEEP